MSVQVIEKIRQEVFGFYSTLSQRERIIIALLAITVVIIALSYLAPPIQQAFSAQQRELKKLEVEIKALPRLTERYLRLKARRNEIESSYHAVELKEGALSHLEKLVTSVAGVSSGFNIKDLPVRKFGGAYEQAPFIVKFKTDDLKKLVKFLEEIVNGPKPLILSRIIINKLRNYSKLDVEIGVSSIRESAARQS
ncbi:MAG: hypothetical protein D6719_03845 [Candidatus Dadabacteria bacterium]|nr:MAG: hypothetical protein D6719_03845 [Candidatus Dadabacteria bacterium]